MTTLQTKAALKREEIIELQGKGMERLQHVRRVTTGWEVSASAHEVWVLGWGSTYCTFEP